MKTQSCISQEVHRILWNPRLKEPGICPYPKPHQSSSHHPIRFLVRSVLLVSSHLLPMCSKWALSLRFPHQSLYAPFLSRHTCHTHLIIFDLGRGFMKLVIVRLPQSPVFLSLLCQYLPQHHIPIHLQRTFFPHCER